MTLTKILCATDFSEGARAALSLACRVAREHGAELLVLHAWGFPAITLMEGQAFSPEVIEQLVTEGEAGLAEAVTFARAAGVERATQKLVEGGAWEAIAGVIEADPRIDLAVVGTHGRTGLSRVLLGSVAERVVRHAACSVLVVRPGPTPSTFNHIACPIDFSESSQVAVDVAAALVRRGGRGITLMHTLELPVSFGGELSTTFASDLDRQATVELDAWASRLRTRVEVPVSMQSRMGRAGAQTLAMIEADPTIDLVVTGSHGRTGVRRWLLGSVAEKIVRHAKPPVLVARRRGP